MSGVVPLDVTRYISRGLLKYSVAEPFPRNCVEPGRAKRQSYSARTRLESRPYPRGCRGVKVLCMRGSC